MKRSAHHVMSARCTSDARRSHRHRAYTLTEVLIVLAVLGGIAALSWPALMRPWSRSLPRQAAQQFAEHLVEARLRAVEESRVYRLRWRPGTGQFEIDSPGAWSEMTASDRVTAAGQSAQSQRLNDASGNSQMAVGLTRPAATSASIMTSIDSATNEAAVWNATPAEPWKLTADLVQGVVFYEPAADAAAQLGLLQQADSRMPTPNPLLTDGGQTDADESQLGTPMPEQLEVPWSEPVWFYPDGRTSAGSWTFSSQDGYRIDVTLRGMTGTVRVGRVQRAPVEEAVLAEIAPEDPADAARNSTNESGVLWPAAPGDEGPPEPSP